MSVQAVYDVSKNSLVRSSALLLCTALIAAACSGGGGGGGGGGGTAPPPPPLIDIPAADDYGNTTGEAITLRTGEGVTSGFINSAGDRDLFSMDLVGGRLYGLQVFNYPIIYNNSPGGALVYELLDTDGFTPIITSATAAYPSGIDNDGNIRFVWIAPTTGTYYIRVYDEFLTARRAYSFQLTSSDKGNALPRESSVSNRRSYHQFVDSEGELLYSGPTSPTRQEGEELTFLSGSITQPKILITLSSELAVVTRIQTGYSVDEVFFMSDGTPNATEETTAMHLHYGVPSSHFSDGLDDVFWNYDPQSPVFSAIGPNFNASPSQNFQVGLGHPVILDFGIDSGVSIDVPIPEDILHLLMGTFWYLDGHFHSQFSLDLEGGSALPLVTSRAQGGVSMFDSQFILNGFDTVPDTGTADEVEIYYNDEHQVFYIQYGYSSALAGNPIHVHSGAPGSSGEVLIDLGVLPFPAIRPVYELSGNTIDGTYLFVPGIENIIKRLTDEEALLLKQASLTGNGWYLDLHTFPDFLDNDHPYIRADAVLGGTPIPFQNGQVWNDFEIVPIPVTSFPAGRSTLNTEGIKP